MDKDALISEICKRVMEKLNNAQLSIDESPKPRLLVLTNGHEEPCREVLECPDLLKHYQIDSGILQDYQCDFSQYRAVIVPQNVQQNQPVQPCANRNPEIEIVLEKRIITEKDIREVRSKGAVVVAVNQKAILTDLAKEYAHKQGIEISRRNLSPAGKDGSL